MNFTVAPLTAAPPDVTVATNGAANAELTGAVCGVPLVGAIEMSVPVMFARLKLTEVVPILVETTATTA